MVKNIPFKEFYDKAQWYIEKIDEISEIIGNKTVLSQNDKHHAQALMKTLKDELKKDFKIAISVRKRQLRADDKDPFYIGVYYAKLKLDIRANSHPIRSNWHDYLSECKSNFEEYVEYLLSKYK